MESINRAPQQEWQIKLCAHEDQNNNLSGARTAAKYRYKILMGMMTTNYTNLSKSIKKKIGGACIGSMIFVFKKTNAVTIAVPFIRFSLSRPLKLIGK